LERLYPTMARRRNRFRLQTNAAKYSVKNRLCYGKKFYATHDSANQAMNSLVSQGLAMVPMDVYPCEHCGGYHFGHTANFR